MQTLSPPTAGRNRRASSINANTNNNRPRNVNTNKSDFEDSVKLSPLPQSDHKKVLNTNSGLWFSTRYKNTGN
jgi:hypothetical protein